MGLTGAGGFTGAGGLATGRFGGFPAGAGGPGFGFASALGAAAGNAGIGLALVPIHLAGGAPGGGTRLSAMRFLSDSLDVRVEARPADEDLRPLFTNVGRGPNDIKVFPYDYTILNFAHFDLRQIRYICV